MTIKHENDEFLVRTLKHVSFLKVGVNRPKTIKLWAIAHENSHKTGKLRILVIYLKHVRVLLRHANPTRTQKL